MGTFLESSILCGNRPQSAVPDTTETGYRKTKPNLNKILKYHLLLWLCVWTVWMILYCFFGSAGKLSAVQCFLWWHTLKNSENTWIKNQENHQKIQSMRGGMNPSCLVFTVVIFSNALRKIRALFTFSDFLPNLGCLAWKLTGACVEWLPPFRHDNTVLSPVNRWVKQQADASGITRSYWGRC